MRNFPLMVFAAGFGTRMGALTADIPKPLIPVAGKPLIDHALDLACQVQPQKTVVNLHYRGDQLAQHLQHRNIALSWESAEILETGGGLRAALPLLGSGPVMTLNSDAIWAGENPLRQLINRWDDVTMDALLLLLPAKQATGHSGTGDFVMDGDGRIQRAAGAPGLVYLGAQIIRTDLLAAVPERVFSLNRLWDQMIQQNRAFGLIHQGGWCDVGRPEGIAQAQALLSGALDV